MSAKPDQLDGFTEKGFYLAEFRGRSLGVALPSPDGASIAALESVLQDFEENGTRVVVICADRSALQKLAGPAVVDASDPRWVAGVWNALRAGSRVGLWAEPSAALAARSREAALRLRLAKLVWLDPSGPLERPGGARLSYVDLEALDRMLGPSEVSDSPRRALLAEVRAMVAGGLPSVAICAPDGLAAELFTYAGSGTFFTRERWLEVRRLGLDEFSAAAHLMQRGVEEGYLVARSAGEEERILTNAFGVFVERRYLAGIGALIPHAADGAGEIGSLYTLTRFTGEGVGGHLVRFALEEAERAGFTYVFACTTSERVERFFQGQGFDSVGAESIPPAKWRGYPEERRARVRCLRRDLS